MTKIDNINEKLKYEKVCTYENGKNENEETTLTYGYGVRHVQMFIIFASLCTLFIARAHISVTIVAMTDAPRSIVRENIKISNVTTFEDKQNKVYMDDEYSDDTGDTNITNKEDIENNVDKYKNFTESDHDDLGNTDTVKVKINSVKINKTDENNSSWSVYKTYRWPKSTQEMVLSAFFLGYLIMMSPMGLVCQRWGGKIPLQIGLICSALLTFFTPWLAVWGDYTAVCLTRVAIGLFQAGTYPSLHTLIAKWAPVSEKGRLATFIYGGAQIGSVLAYHVSGFLAASKFGWPSVYWVVGVLCLLMFILMTTFVSATPQQHRHISQDEKNFILGRTDNQAEKRRPTPWKAIMTSKVVWACFVAHIGSSVIFILFFNQIPTYMHAIIGFNIRSSGLLSSLPYFANFLTSVSMGIFSDYLTNNNILTIKSVRIISSMIASCGPALCLFAVSFVNSPTLAVAILVLCMATHSFVHTGWMVNYIDMSPNFSGTLMATGNTMMNVTTLILPMIISVLITDVTNVYQWRIVFFIVGTFGLICSAVYCVFMSADVQPWNESSYETTGQDDPDKETKITDKDFCKKELQS